MPVFDNLPSAFIDNVTGAFPGGAAWIASLPKLIQECETRWRLTIGPPFELSYNFVAPAETADGHPVVVKLGVPNPDLILEMRALRVYGGHAAVQLIDTDEVRGLLLLERVQPGHTLASIKDDEAATRAAAQVMRDLWRPLPEDSTFPTTRLWATGLTKLRHRFNGGTGPFPVPLIEQAETLFRELFASAVPPVLLHGDLHHGNILAAQRRPWLAIDPKGVAGEPAYEVGALLRNPHPNLFLNPATQRSRVEILQEELGFEKKRMLGWGVAQAVLAAWWSFGDSGADWREQIACAAVLSGLREEL